MIENKIVINDAKKRLNDILLAISWREIAQFYFGKSASWLYHKLDGIKGDGSKNGGFSPNEAEQLKNALYDLSQRIKNAADTLI